MIIILGPDVAADGPEVRSVVQQAARYPNITTKIHAHKGEKHSLVEVHLIGETKIIPLEPFANNRAGVKVAARDGRG